MSLSKKYQQIYLHSIYAVLKNKYYPIVSYKIENQSNSNSSKLTQLSN